MKDKIVFLLKTYSNDFKYAKRLIESFDKYNRDNIKLYIVFPKTDYALLGSFLKKYETVKYLPEEEFANYVVHKPVNNFTPGYINQQIVKISFWEQGICENYFCLDSDSVFIRTFGIKDFIAEDGYPYTVLHDDNRLYVNPEYYRFHWKSRAKYLRIIRKCLDIKGKMLTCHGFQIMNSDVLKNLKECFMLTHGYTYADIMKIAPYEFSWYTYYFQQSGIAPLHPVGELFVCFHTPKQYIGFVIQGTEVADLSRGYIGYIIQSNFYEGRDNKYGDLAHMHFPIECKYWRYIVKQLLYSIYYNFRQDIKKIVCNKIKH